MMHRKRDDHRVDGLTEVRQNCAQVPHLKCVRKCPRGRGALGERQRLRREVNAEVAVRREVRQHQAGHAGVATAEVKDPAGAGASGGDGRAHRRGCLAVAKAVAADRGLVDSPIGEESPHRRRVLMSHRLQNSASAAGTAADHSTGIPSDSSLPCRL